MDERAVLNVNQPGLPFGNVDFKKQNFSRAEKRQ